MFKTVYNNKFSPKVIMTLGFFDCMHKGHIKLLEKSKLFAQKYDAYTALFTFDNNHLAVMGKDSKLIYTYDERLEILQQLGVDVVVAAHFDKAFMSTDGLTFLQTLHNCYNIAAVVCGFDYTCGSDRKNSQFVADFFAQYNIPVSVISQVTDSNGEKISSTLIRRLLFQHNIAKANELLTIPFSISGEVVKGRQVGRSIGFPTANIAVSKDKLLPDGVYGGYIDYQGKRYKAIVNIGNAPTFDFEMVTVEAHIIDFNQNIYGNKMRIFITQYLRAIKKFNDKQELQAQLVADTESVLND